MQRRRLTEAERWRIIGATQDSGKPIQEVANQFNIDRSVVHRLIRRYQETGNVQDRKKTGRPRKMQQMDEHFATSQVLADRKVSLTTIRQRLADQRNIQVSKQTITRVLRARGFRSRKPKRCPAFTAANKTKRLEFALAHVHWDLPMWKRVIWTDESSYRLRISADGRVRVWRRPTDDKFSEEFVAPVCHKGGPTVMIWGAISWEHKSALHYFDSTVTGDSYLNEVLLPLGLPFARASVLDFIWMDDNAPPHRARTVRDFMQAEGVHCMVWPPNSPDLNPIEKLWDMLRCAVTRRNPRPANIADLCAALGEEWDNIPMYIVRNLIRSMRNRCLAVIQTNGGATKY